MGHFDSEVYSDYNYLLNNINLRVKDPIRSLLLMQTVIGHAQNNHGMFNSKYPNATLDDIVLALGKDPEKIRRQRQGVIDSIFSFAAEIMYCSKYPGYVDPNGNPLLALDFNFSLDNPAATLIGIYLASCMDNFEWRTKAMEEYDIDIGGGECVAVDLKANDFRLRGLTLGDLADREWSDEEVADLKESGVIIPNIVRASTNKVVSAYVRHRGGKGTSDDLAIILAGRLYGKDAAMGVFLCDAIDTWDKYAEWLVPGGQDEHLGGLIKQHEGLIKGTYPGFELPSEEDITKFIYTISLEKAKNNAVSNSQRYLLQVDSLTNQSAVESHLGYIVNGNFNPMYLGHIKNNITSSRLYALFEKRFAENYLCR
ncbi:MAG: hypothetical protein V1914_01225 [archaeon]